MSSASGDVGRITMNIGDNLEAITSIAASAHTVLEASHGVSDAGQQIDTSARDLADVSDRLEEEVRAFRL
jgi:methyl-accepting chemotaxis protein